MNGKSMTPKKQLLHSDNVKALVHKNNPHRKRNIAVILLLVALVLFIAFAIYQANNKQSKKVSDNPVISQYQRQLPSLASNVQKTPNDAAARREYAVALYATGDKGKAKEQYEQQIKLAPQDATAYNNLGNVYRDLADYEKAVSSYQKSIDLDHKQTNAYVNLSNLYLYTLDKKDLAITTLEGATSNSPDNMDLKVLLGIAYERSDNKDKAREIYQSVLEKDSQNQAAQAGMKRLG